MDAEQFDDTHPEKVSTFRQRTYAFFDAGFRTSAEMLWLFEMYFMMGKSCTIHAVPVHPFQVRRGNGTRPQAQVVKTRISLEADATQSIVLRNASVTPEPVEIDDPLLWKDLGATVGNRKPPSQS